VLDGLTGPEKYIPSKYFYDEIGSRLFDRICDLEEYYPTRTEIGIMRENIGEMVSLMGPQVLLVEYGSGSSLKTRILLERMDQLAGYVPIDISREHLIQSAARIEKDYPRMSVIPIHADYTSDVHIPVDPRSFERKIVYFPGSTIGNFDPSEAESFLQRMARLTGKGGGLLIGVDLLKDVQVLEAAYNDARGVTAAFNLNLLARINRELGADFQIDRFGHRAVFNAERNCIEMHLVSRVAQEVHLGSHTFSFLPGEAIHTENSYKYSLPQFADLARRADFKVQRLWTDRACLFSVQYLTVV
jgi:dimethylhistidine N-methyltransferase